MTVGVTLSVTLSVTMCVTLYVSIGVTLYMTFGVIVYVNLDTAYAYNLLNIGSSEHRYVVSELGTDIAGVGRGG